MQLGTVVGASIASFIPGYLRQFKNYKDLTLDYLGMWFVWLVFTRPAIPLAITIYGLVSTSHHDFGALFYAYLLFGVFLGQDIAELSRLVRNGAEQTPIAKQSTSNDFRIKRLLKRYPKEAILSDASIDVSNMEVKELLLVCGCQNERELSSPVRLDDQAIAAFAGRLGMEFDSGRFDYFLHSYIRTEFVQSYFNDPTVTFKPAPESGPPANIPLTKGFQWVAVRPKDGREHWEAYEQSEMAFEGEATLQSEWHKLTRH